MTVKWKKHTAYHWSGMLDDSRIDYWPTKKKWRHEGQYHTGDVKDYIACFSDPKVKKIANQFAAMDAQKQAAFFSEIMRVDIDWEFQLSEMFKEMSETARGIFSTALASPINREGA